MKRTFCVIFGGLFFLSLLWLPPTSSARENSAPSIPLTQEERDWLAAHPEISYASDPDFPPIESIDEKGHHIGIAKDFVDLMTEKLGIRFKLVPVKSWDEVLEKGRTREVDLWSGAAPTPQRLEYMSFTEPYINLPAVIVTTQGKKNSLTMDDLDGMK
ncbi:MAG: transporter substrate-binding domain-containing protein, partial [Nitrospinae bacterium]|nr:transporter substrate-binding domain-containing protein [Nitrospinota bacterium]